MKKKKLSVTNNKTLIIYTILIILLIFSIILNKSFFDSVLLEISKTSASIFIVCCLLGVGYRILDGVTIYILCSKHDNAPSLSDCIKISLYGAFFMVTTLGSGMAVSKIYFLNKKNLSIGSGMGACLVQTIFFKLSIFIMGAGALIFNRPVRQILAPKKGPVIFATIFFTLIVAFMILVAVCKPLTDAMFKIGYKAAKGHEKAISFIDKTKEQVDYLNMEANLVLQDKKQCLILLCISLIMQFMWYLIPGLIVRDTDIGLMQVVAIMSVACMLAGVIPAPSGYGSVEVLFSMIFAGVSSSVMGVTAIVLFRFTSTFMPFFVGAFMLFLYKKNEENKLEDLA